MLEILDAGDGSASHLHDLGIMNLEGRAMAVNNAVAVDMFRAAADRGFGASMLILSAMYFDGRGVVQDYVQGHMWANLAASRLTGEDRERAVSNRDRFAQGMTRDQIAEAQRLALEWNAAHPREP